MATESKTRAFSFTVWDLIMVTAFVAALFASPIQLLELIVGAAILGSILLFLLGFPVMPVQRLKEGSVIQFLHRMVLKWFCYFVMTVLVGATAMILKGYQI